MAVRIRLTRTGAAKQPHYRLVVADSRSPRDGRFIEIIGHYNPRVDPPELVVDVEKAAEWISVERAHPTLPALSLPRPGSRDQPEGSNPTRSLNQRPSRCGSSRWSRWLQAGRTG